VTDRRQSNISCHERSLQYSCNASKTCKQFHNNTLTTSPQRNRKPTTSPQYLEYDLLSNRFTKIEVVVYERNAGMRPTLNSFHRLAFTWGRWKCTTWKFKTWKCSTNLQGVKMQDWKCGTNLQGWKKQERKEGDKKSMESRVSNNFYGSTLKSNWWLSSRQHQS